MGVKLHLEGLYEVLEMYTEYLVHSIAHGRHSQMAANITVKFSEEISTGTKTKFPLDRK